MRGNFILLAGFFLTMCFLSGTASNSTTNKISSDVTLCNFEVPRDIKIGNANFTIGYAFELDEKGNPIKIEKMFDSYIGSDKVLSCIEKWKFSGFQKGAHIAAYFRWEHEVGWVDVTLKGIGYSQQIRVTGNTCPYAMTEK